MATKKASKKAAKGTAKRAVKAPRKAARKSKPRADKWKQLNGFFVKLHFAAKKMHGACLALRQSDPKFAALEKATLEFENVLKDLVDDGPGGPPGVDK